MTNTFWYITFFLPNFCLIQLFCWHGLFCSWIKKFLELIFFFTKTTITTTTTTTLMGFDTIEINLVFLKKSWIADYDRADTSYPRLLEINSYIMQAIYISMTELRIRLLSILATTKIYLIMKSCYITSSRLLWLLLFPLSLALYILVNPS